MANFVPKTTFGYNPAPDNELPVEIARALDAAADDVRHDRTEDIREYVKRKEAELRAHIAREVEGRHKS